MIEFIPMTHITTQVILDGKVVGSIKESSRGFRYTPKGSKTSGCVFKTLQQCKDSLINPDAEQAADEPHDVPVDPNTKYQYTAINIQMFAKDFPNINMFEIMATIMDQRHPNRIMLSVYLANSTNDCANFIGMSERKSQRFISDIGYSGFVEAKECSVKYWQDHPFNNSK